MGRYRRREPGTRWTGSVAVWLLLVRTPPGAIDRATAAWWL
ncbi:hypothetical protein SAMN04489832_6013 [Micromonospora cremea]|uniref:Uncharacterized protein n=1 Tax=Micromonospora cremea TaxID=709881 RepID=A0A1N6ARK2_9ACTN|nr:hypothetical protein SAMN04489832_6013 [Micromonospora cremea]